MMIYWLWYGEQIVAIVRLPGGASDQDVRYAALRDHDRVPTCNRPLEAPFERRYKISFARVKTYPGGN